MKQHMAALKLELHPDKTSMGRIESLESGRGFDFLGYHHSRNAQGQASLQLAHHTVRQAQVKLSRLYEQRRNGKTTAAPGSYLSRWRTWAQAGLQGVALNLPTLAFMLQTHSGQPE